MWPLVASQAPCDDDPAKSVVIRRSVRIPARPVELEADVTVTDAPRGVVAFAHGSGSSRHSSRNRYVAEVLERAALATVLADLLTADEERTDERTAQHRFDIELLTERVIALVDWLGEWHETAGLALGLFGASTGAAAALMAAAERAGPCRAVVSRGGRPDLAGDALGRVTQPVLLVVGGRDDLVLDLNRQAMRRLGGDARLEVVPGATHLFEEPGALEEVARLARDWFTSHLDPPGGGGR